MNFLIFKRIEKKDFLLSLFLIKNIKKIFIPKSIITIVLLSEKIYNYIKKLIIENKFK